MDFQTFKEEFSPVKTMDFDGEEIEDFMTKKIADVPESRVWGVISHGNEKYITNNFKKENPIFYVITEKEHPVDDIIEVDL